MNDAKKTKAQLLDELNQLRAREKKLSGTPDNSTLTESDQAVEELDNIFNLSADLICICTTHGDLV